MICFIGFFYSYSFSKQESVVGFSHIAILSILTFIVALGSKSVLGLLHKGEALTSGGLYAFGELDLFAKLFASLFRLLR